MRNVLILFAFLSSFTYKIIASQQTAPQRSELLRYRREGDVIIGGIFSLHEGGISTEYADNTCYSFDMYTYNQALAMMFVIQNTNRNPLMLPNTTVGFEIYDSCANTRKCLESTFWFLSGRSKEFPNYNCHSSSNAAAMVAEWLPANSVAIAQLLGLYRFPQVSHGTEESFLSDHVQFPSFLRSIPSNRAVLDGVIQLLLYYKWTWVSVLVPADLSAQETTLELKTRLINAGICIELFQTVPITDPEQEKLAKVVRTLSSKVFIAAHSSGLQNLLEVIAVGNMSGITWIGLDWWPMSASYYYPVFHKLLQGTLWFTPATKLLNGFQNFQYSIDPSNDPNDVFARILWEKLIGCKWPKYNTSYVLPDGDTNVCTGTENLRNVKSGFFNDNVFLLTYTAFNAVSAIVYALHELQTCATRKGPFLNGSCAQFPYFQPWQFFHYLRHVSLTTYVNEALSFNEEGYIPLYYFIGNWQVQTGGIITYILSGTYNPQKPVNNSLSLNNRIIWNGGNKQPPRSVCSESCLPGYRKVIPNGKPACCFDCVLCAEGEIANQSDSTVCLSCPLEEWPNERRSKCIERSTEFLSYDDPLGVALACITVMGSLLTAATLVIFIRFNDTPIVKANNQNLSFLLLISLMLCFLCSFIFIGYPNGLTCRIRQAVFGISFVLSVSCVLAKTIMVVVAFNATKPNSKFRRWVGPQLSYTIVLLCTVSQVIICITWAVCFSPYLEHNFKTQPGLIIIECNEGSATAFWCMMGYMGVLAGICFVVAFLSRNLPDSFNEAKFISFSMVVFVSVWLGFIPAYLSTKGKYTVAVEIFAITASSAGLLVCIFSPKCFIIVMRPDINTKAYLMGKGTQGR